MPKVLVRMFATVREVAGTSQCTLNAVDLADLFDKLGDRFGSKLGLMLKSWESDPETLVVLLNGRNITRITMSSTPLQEGDEVSLFPPVSGG